MELEKRLADKYGEFLEKHPSGVPMLDIIEMPDRDAIELKLIQVSKEHRGEGVGSKIMEELTEYADKNNLILVLSPSEIKRNKLIKWYKTFDFVENKNRNKDFRFMNRMIRYPHGNTRSKWIKTQADYLPGGLADKHSINDFDQEQLAKGVEIELEHTDDFNLALEIAMDHLVEIPDYYDRLEEMEKEAESGYKVQNDDHVHIVNQVIDSLEKAKDFLNIEFEIADLMLMGSQTSDKENPEDIDVYVRVMEVKDSDGHDSDELLHALWETLHDELLPYYNGTQIDITLSEEEFENRSELCNPQPLILQSDLD